jgi:hypothetical protein
VERSTARRHGRKNSFLRSLRTFLHIGEFDHPGILLYPEFLTLNNRPPADSNTADFLSRLLKSTCRHCKRPKGAKQSPFSKDNQQIASSLRSIRIAIKTDHGPKVSSFAPQGQARKDTLIVFSSLQK